MTSTDVSSQRAGGTRDGHTVHTRRTRLNFAIFAVAAVGAGWLGVLLDQASGVDLKGGVAMSNTSGTTGQLVFILGPAVVAVVLYLASRDGAGPLGFTLRFPHRLRWFGGAVAIYPAITVIAVGTGVAVGSVELSATPAAGEPAFLPRSCRSSSSSS